MKNNKNIKANDCKKTAGETEFWKMKSEIKQEKNKARMAEYSDGTFGNLFHETYQ